MSQEEPMPTRVRPPSRPLNRRSVGPGTLSAINPNSSSNITQNIENNTQNDVYYAQPLPSIPVITPIEKKPLPERPQLPIRPERAESRPPLPERPNINSNSTPVLPSKPPEKPPPVPFARPSLAEKPSTLPALPDKPPPKPSVIEKPPLPGKPDKPPLPEKPNNHVERERPPPISLLSPSHSEKNSSLKANSESASSLISKLISPRLSRANNSPPITDNNDRYEMSRRTSDAPPPSFTTFDRRMSECPTPKFNVNEKPSLSKKIKSSFHNSTSNSSSSINTNNHSTNNNIINITNNNNSSSNINNTNNNNLTANNNNNNKSEVFMKGLIEKFGKDFEWFGSNWEKETESKREEYFQSLLSYFQSFNFIVDNNASNSANNSSSTPAQQAAPAPVNTYLHMSIKEKWSKADSNLSVTFEEDRLKELAKLVEPVQTMLTCFISSTYKAINVQLNISGTISSDGNELEIINVDKIESSIIPMITKIIDLISEDGNSSVQLINDMRKRILTQISSTNYKAVPKEHILTAANESHNPKYLNKLVVIRLNTLLSRLRSLIVQIANIIGGLDLENFIVDHKTILEVLSCLRLTTTTIKKVADQLATSLTLMKLIDEKNIAEKSSKKKKKEKSFSLKRKKSEKGIVDSIYSFNVNQPKLEGWEEGAGTLNSLVLKLTSTESIDQTFMKSFITTYPTFTTTELLLKKCLERYHVPKTYVAEEKMQVQLRVCIVFKYWIENKIKDFDDVVIAQFNDFVETLKCDGHMDAAKMLKTTIDKSVDKVNEGVVINFSKIEIFDVKYSPTEMFMNSSEKDIAEQITLISWRMYKDIDVNELLKLAWSKRQTRHRSPNIKAFIKRFNHVSFWVPTMILFHEKLKDRSKLISKFIGVSQELRKLNNFDGLMYIISGLRNSAVDRLKFSKFTVHEDQLVAFEDLANMMDPTQSWKTYRDTLRASSLPAIPFMGVYLTDLTFIEDGNSDTYRDGELINFNKRQMVYKVLQEVLLYQTIAYQIEPKEPLLSYLTQIPFLEESDLYLLSTQREPRNCTIKDLV